MEETVGMIPRIKDWLLGQGLTTGQAEWLSYIVAGLALLILSGIANFMARKIILVAVGHYVRKSATQWDDVLLKRHVFHRFSHLAPALVFYFSGAIFPTIKAGLQRMSILYMVLVGVFVVDAFLNAVHDIYMNYDIARRRPIKGYLQVIKIIIFIFVVIYLIASLIGQSPLVILSGLGAMTAVLMLIFKDSILGLVAGVQLSFNDLVRIGDWIEIPRFGADGEVIDITLNTVKVCNWDKTITSVPAYAMVTDAFKNWRSMSESGGRRIKRAIYIDMQTVKFCDDEMIHRFRKIQYLSDYIAAKEKEIAEFNLTKNIDVSSHVNGRKLTNLGTFRAYIHAYLRNHPLIRQDMTFLVRHLSPGESGLPVEIYVFSANTEWAAYEGIQADIFDHILAAVPEFDLRVFQNPSGFDFLALSKLSKK